MWDFFCLSVGNSTYEEDAVEAVPANFLSLNQGKFNLYITITLITAIIIVISLLFISSTAHYDQVHTEDGRRICRNVFVKLKGVVLFIKFITDSY